MKILVLGASGQLGQCIKKIAVEKNKQNDLIFPEEHTADILDKTMLKSLFEETNPSYVINCAAYTAVDKAEDDIELCRKVNAIGALNIALLCKDFGAAMIHISTDFVFRGDLPDLLKENDPAAPINIYGLTKLEGEREIQANLPEHFIFRTSWLYSEYGNNFVKTMLRLGGERSELNVIADQIGTPTYAMDLAKLLLMVAQQNKKEYGLYHYSNEGVASWYDFASGVFELGNMAVKVRPIPTSQYPARAIRPKFSVMDKTKVKEIFGIEVPHWRQSLQECIDKLNDL